MTNSIKSFKTAKEMAMWKAQETHESNLEMGGCYSEGVCQDLINEGYEFREVSNSEGFYRVSNFKLELEAAKKKVVKLHSAYDISNHQSKYVIFGDNGVIAKKAMAAN